MNNYEFYDLILDNLSLSLGLLFLFIVVHYLIFRKYVTSVLDPILLPVISSVFSMADVYLLFFTNSISTYLFINFNLTQLAFWFGLFYFKTKINSKFNTLKTNTFSNNFNNTLSFYFFSIIYLCSQVLIYVTKGIPLLKESRLETFADGGGEGVLGRIVDVTSIFCLYSFFKIIKVGKLSFSDVPKYVIIILIFLTFLLTGSKSTFLNLFLVFWCFIIFNRIKGNDSEKYINIIKKYRLRIFVFILTVVSLIIFVQINYADNENKLNPLVSLFIRFIHSGDVYWYAYPNNVYLNIKSNAWFSALFTDFLGLFRIVGWNNLPEAIGITFKDIHHPSDIPSGPNARHNVFGLIYYGFFGGILFSFLLGVIISFVRNKLPFILKDTMLNGFIFTFLMIKISGLDTDPMLTFTYLNNLLFIFPIIFFGFLFFLALFKTKLGHNDK